MKRIAALTLCLLASTASFGLDGGYTVTYNGGSLHTVKAGTAVRLRIDAHNIHLVSAGSEIAAIPSADIETIAYNENSSLRRSDALSISAASSNDTPSILTRSNQRSVILTWTSGDRKGGFAMQCEKNECPIVLAALQSVTGKQVTDFTSNNIQ